MDASSAAGNVEVSTFRLYLLRAAYLIIFVGLAILIWPGLINPPLDLAHSNSVVRGLLGGVSLLALLGIRYPLQMIPLLLFELVWKAIWVLAFGLPVWSAGALTPPMEQTLFDCLFGIVLVVVVLPWRYVVARYVKLPADRWRKAPAA